MRQIVPVIALATLALTPALASAHVSVGIGLDVPLIAPAAVYPAPPVVYAPAPVYAAPVYAAPVPAYYPPPAVVYPAPAYYGYGPYYGYSPRVWVGGRWGHHHWR